MRAYGAVKSDSVAPDTRKFKAFGVATLCCGSVMVALGRQNLSSPLMEAAASEETEAAHVQYADSTVEAACVDADDDALLMLTSVPKSYLFFEFSGDFELGSEPIVFVSMGSIRKWYQI